MAYRPEVRLILDTHLKKRIASRTLDLITDEILSLFGHSDKKRAGSGRTCIVSVPDPNTVGKTKTTTVKPRPYGAPPPDIAVLGPPPERE